MLRRELAIAFRSWVTWAAGALGALFVGHGLVLALAVYSGFSRSALAGGLMRRELDPLAGIVRPMLGGAELATAVLVPVVAARLLSVEKERRSFGALAIAAGSVERVVATKLLAALAASLLLVAPTALLCLVVIALGARLDAIEIAIAIGGHALHGLAVAAVAVAAAAWTRRVAAAVALALVVSIASWAIEAGEGIAALGWLSPFEAMSLGAQLAPFEHGIVGFGPIAWLVLVIAFSAALAFVGASFDRPPRARALLGAALVVGLLLGLRAASSTKRGWDWSEARRASLPPAAVDALRALDMPIAIDVYLDREDSRRRQLERDTLAKLLLARPDIVVTMPLDASGRGGDVRDDVYGRIVLRVGARSSETRSTSRKEITTRIFELAGKPLPDWAQPEYAGYPFVVEGARATIAAAAAYGVLPAAFVVCGFVLTRRRRRSRGIEGT